MGSCGTLAGSTPSEILPWHLAFMMKNIRKPQFCSEGQRASFWNPSGFFLWICSFFLLRSSDILWFSVKISCGNVCVCCKTSCGTIPGAPRGVCGCLSQRHSSPCILNHFSWRANRRSTHVRIGGDTQNTFSRHLSSAPSPGALGVPLLLVGLDLRK